MAAKGTFKPIDKAFAILFLLLIATSILHVSSVAGIGEGRASSVLQLPAEVERFRALDRDLCVSLDYLDRTSIGHEVKTELLSTQLERIEESLRDLGRSDVRISGMTRLVEPYMHIREVRSKIHDQRADLKTLFEPGGSLDRALQASQFVVRANITRLGEESTKATSSFFGVSDNARRMALMTGFAAIVVFWPVRLMARRAAAKPLEALQAATRAVGEERWHASSIEAMNDDAVGELVTAFHTMADKLRESRKQRSSAFHKTLTSLVQTIEAKDAYVSNHSYNVTKLGEMLARAIGLPEHEVEEVACGGLLHDVGKIGIPDEIINKPGKLTDAEFKVIQEHPVIGCRIVKPLDGSEVLLPAVRHHHEHWCGGGYPDGLAGEDIPLAARIIAVSDVFEALISDRSYRKRLTLEKAIEILESEAGKKLDPRLVKTFVSEVLPGVRELLPDIASEKDGDGSPHAAPVAPANPQTVST